MLLYDRIMEAAWRVRRDRPLTPREDGFMRTLSIASVYEITSVVPHMGDWHQEIDKPIPKRPPGENVWCECRFEDSAGNAIRHGALIAEVPASRLLSVATPEHRRTWETAQGQRWMLDLGDTDLTYEVAEFYMLERATNASLRADFGSIYRPAVAADVLRIGFTENAVRHLGQLPITLATPGVFGLPVRLRGGNRMVWGGDTFWEPFMAFALLHCRNVVAEDVTPSVGGQRVRHAGPSRVSYKIITAEVPTLISPGTDLPGEMSGDVQTSVRRHLCRGHLKNLTHPKWKMPGWHWWPAHWRGDRELGYVVSDHKLVLAGA